MYHLNRSPLRVLLPPCLRPPLPSAPRGEHKLDSGAKSVSKCPDTSDGALDTTPNVIYWQTKWHGHSFHFFHSVCIFDTNISKSLDTNLFPLLSLARRFFAHRCLSFACVVSGYCQNLDNLIPTSNHDSPTVVPKFVSRGHLYKAIVSDTIELPCKVQNLGNARPRGRRESIRQVRLMLPSLPGSYVLLWRRGTSVLTAGHLKITRDDRFKIVGDYNLQISDVKTQDAGDYICQIGDQETRDQVHTVEILGKIDIGGGPTNDSESIIDALQFRRRCGPFRRTGKWPHGRAAQWLSNAKRPEIQSHQFIGLKRYRRADRSIQWTGDTQTVSVAGHFLGDNASVRQPDAHLGPSGSPSRRRLSMRRR